MIRYRDGLKYQLAAEYQVGVPIRPPLAIITEYVSLDIEGVLTIREGFAWNGPSGPTIDTGTFMRGPLAHDALYGLMQSGHLDHGLHRAAADACMRDLILEDIETKYSPAGLGRWHPKRAILAVEREFLRSRARAWYDAVRIAGGPNADPANERPILIAP